MPALARFFSFPERIFIRWWRGNRHAEAFLILSAGHMGLTFIERTRLPDGGQNELLFLVYGLMLLLIPLFLVLRLALEAGYLWFLIRVMKKFPFSQLWFLICAAAVIDLFGEWINQALILLTGSAETGDPFTLMRTGLNLLTTPEKAGAGLYLILGEVTPFALWYMIFLIRNTMEYCRIPLLAATGMVLGLWFSEAGLSVLFTIYAGSDV